MYIDKTQFVFGFVLSESCSRMTCHSWMGPVGVMEGACDTGAGEENTEEERGGLRGRASRGARVNRRGLLK